MLQLLFLIHVAAALLPQDGNPPTVVIPTPAPIVWPPYSELPPSTARAAVNEIAPKPGTAVTDDAPVPVHILDLVEVEGVRSNQLYGTGLVVGLNGTGDKGNATKQALANFMRQRHLNITPQDLDIANVALVTVTAMLPPFAKNGTRIDVTVQALNGATSLFGGTLLQTQLFGVDGHVHVLAQGAVPVGGFAVGGKAASITQNHPTVGIMIGGGIVEEEVPMTWLAPDGALHLHLRAPNYQTATRVAQQIRKLAVGARALDAATIRVELSPEKRADVIGFLAELGEQDVVPGQEAVVVLNERTGTVVAGANVRISTVAVTHGNLTISVAESAQPSQPQPFSDGETTTVNRTDINATTDSRALQVIQGGTTVSQLAESLNRIGVTPRDLVAIFQALAQAGALHARLEIH